MQLVDLLASLAATRVVASADLGGLRIQMVTYDIATLLVLLVLTALSVYKPQGMTRYGWRNGHARAAMSDIQPMPALVVPYSSTLTCAARASPPMVTAASLGHDGTASERRLAVF